MHRLAIEYLTFWASCVMRRHRPFVIGVTGSAGKSTTVAMIAAALSQPAARPIVGRVASTQNNMNCDVGLPLTLLRYNNWIKGTLLVRLMVYAATALRALRLMAVGGYPDVLVLEYAAFRDGHIRRLAGLAPPDIAVVTTIGAAHLDRLKTVDAVAREKGLLVKAAPPDGLVILGDGHDHVATLQAMARAPVVRVEGRGLDLAIGIARAVARHLGAPEEAVEGAAMHFEPPKRRLQTWRLGPFTVIDDSFNANPLSMKLALETLGETVPAAPAGRRLAVLGEMAELGDEAWRFHGEVEAVAHRHADVVIGVGDLARHYRPARWYPTSGACAEAMASLVNTGDCILVKGSHSAHMPRIVNQLKRIAAAADEQPNNPPAGSITRPARPDVLRSERFSVVGSQGGLDDE